jgi:sigma-B regulation protein RsbU (phosphoserine phosphatase)
MLMTQSQIASMRTASPNMGPDTALRRVNALLYENVHGRLRDDKYVTARLFVYAGGGAFDYAGGHEWPIVWRAATGRCEQIEAEGPWLGIVADLPDTPVARLTLAPGDILCLYTDGIVETMARGGEEQFEAHRMMEALADAARNGSSLAGMADAVFAAAERWGEQDDDRTLLLIRRRAARAAGPAGGSAPS